MNCRHPLTANRVDAGTGDSCSWRNCSCRIAPEGPAGSFASSATRRSYCRQSGGLGGVGLRHRCDQAPGILPRVRRNTGNGHLRHCSASTQRASRPATAQSTPPEYRLGTAIGGRLDQSCPGRTRILPIPVCNACRSASRSWPCWPATMRRPSDRVPYREDMSGSTHVPSCS